MSQPVLNQRYTLVALLGSGNQGEVYLAEDEKLEREVAVKLLKKNSQPTEKDIILFRREAKITARFKHPNVVSIYDYDISEENRPFLVMEYLSGQSVDEVVPRLTRGEVSLFVAQIGSALQTAHERDLLHRDMKPSNVVLVDRGMREQRFKLLDLGIAKLSSMGTQAGTIGQMTFAGAGTPLYMSPEQVNGESGDARSDIYAFASTVYELLSGQSPFSQQAVTLLELLNAVQAQPAPRLSETTNIEPEIDQLLDECLAKQPKDRPPSMREVVERYLSAVRNSVSVSAPSTLEPMQNSETKPINTPAVRDVGTLDTVKSSGTETVAEVGKSEKSWTGSANPSLSSIHNNRVVRYVAVGMVCLALILIGLKAFFPAKEDTSSLADGGTGGTIGEASTTDNGKDQGGKDPDFEPGMVGPQQPNLDSSMIV